jgi:hypothetical protein
MLGRDAMQLLLADNHDDAAVMLGGGASFWHMTFSYGP